MARWVIRRGLLAVVGLGLAAFAVAGVARDASVYVTTERIRSIPVDEAALQGSAADHRPALSPGSVDPAADDTAGRPGEATGTQKASVTAAGAAAGVEQVKGAAEAGGDGDTGGVDGQADQPVEPEFAVVPGAGIPFDTEIDQPTIEGPIEAAGAKPVAAAASSTTASSSASASSASTTSATTSSAVPSTGSSGIGDTETTAASTTSTTALPSSPADGTTTTMGSHHGGGHDPTPSDTSAPPAVTHGTGPADYGANLSMIRAQTVRNRNHDGSPYRSVPQAALDVGDGSPLLGPRSAYLDSPNGNPEQAFPIPAGGQFRIACEFSHFAYDDPLIAPGHPGGAHLHLFFGNTDVNAYSTYGTLRDTGSSTCNGQELNRSGYWVPAMIDGSGQARIPERIVVYYKGEGVARGRAEVYDPGMANISPAGTGIAAHDGTAGGAAGEVEYKCTDNFSGPAVATGTGRIPTCDGSRFGSGAYPGRRVVLEMEIKFWHCVDPAMSVTDWRSWVPAGPGRGHWFYGNCDGAGGGPTDPPRRTFPHLTYFVNYVVEPGEDTSDWFLSSDVDPASLATTPALSGPAGSTHHADWWGAWHPVINREFIDNCVNFADPSGAPSGCGFGYLSNGGSDGGAPAPGRALRYRPQYDRPGDSSTLKTSLATLFAELCVPNGPRHHYTTPMSGAWCTPHLSGHAGHG
ncbi:MAG: DUF1996 domain-containing protein [Actinomycetota bacterium]